MKRLSLITIAIVCVSVVCFAGKRKNPSKWYRGNTHTHSTLSDGDSPMADVVKWYKEYGYDFILATDHNINYSPVDSVNQKNFLIIPSNEVSDAYVHLTAMGIKRDIAFWHMNDDYHIGKYADGVHGPAEAEAARVAIYSNGIVDAGAIAILNHPNFVTGVQSSDLYPAPNLTHIEVFNGHPQCYNWGNENHKSVGQKWDDVLSRGKMLYGVASDDTHTLKQIGAQYANPGRGWIMVNADDLTTEKIMDAVAKGDFYASSGVFFSKYTRSADKLTVKINVKKSIEEYNRGNLFPNVSNSGVEGFNIEVIGQNGVVLRSLQGTELTYKLTNNDKYARIVVSYTVKDGDLYNTFYAWTQPIINR